MIVLAFCESRNGFRKIPALLGYNHFAMALPNHILLIADDPAVARGVQDGLEREGFLTTWKSSGQEGLVWAREHLPALILLDLRLPDISGFDVCRQVRQAGLHMPVVILTVQRDEIDRVLGLEIGADDYIVKPFSLREKIEPDPAHPP